MPLTRQSVAALTIMIVITAAASLDPMPILDSRQGKNFQLLRCLGCGKMGWSKERSPRLVHARQIEPLALGTYAILRRSRWVGENVGAKP